MQRVALISGIVAAVLAGPVAYADDAAPSSAVEPAAPAAQPASPSPATAPTPQAAPSTQTAPPVSPSAQSSPTPAQEAAPPAQQTAPPAATAAPPTLPVPPAVQSVPSEDAEAILGQRVNDPQGKEIGRLVDVLVDANSQPQAAVIDFGGFMGVGNRKIAVHWSALRFSPADPKNKVVLNMTQDQIKSAPEFRNPSKAAAVVIPAEPAPSSP